MNSRITLKDLLKNEKDEGIPDLLGEKRKKIIFNLSLMAIYIALIIASLLIN